MYVYDYRELHTKILTHHPYPLRPKPIYKREKKFFTPRFYLTRQTRMDVITLPNYNRPRTPNYTVVKVVMPINDYLLTDP